MRANPLALACSKTLDVLQSKDVLLAPPKWGSGSCLCLRRCNDLRQGQAGAGELLPLPSPLAGCWGCRVPAGSGVMVGNPVPLVSPVAPVPHAPEMPFPPFGAVAVTVKALFQRAAYSHPSPPMAFFISFWLGIRHVLTEQTFCCPQNPPLRREVTSSRCRCPEPAPGWGEPFRGKAEPLRVTSCTGAGARLPLSCGALIAFCFNIPSCETRDATKECCPSPMGLWRALVAQLCVSPAHLPALVTVLSSLRFLAGAAGAEDARELSPGACVCRGKATSSKL